MKISISILTGIIYAQDGKKEKIDVTEECINSVAIRLAENFDNDYVLVSKADGKKYKLKLEEVP